MFKAKPEVWDIGAAFRDGVKLDWWRLAPTYRAGLLKIGQPCVLWVTRGDSRVPSGVWAVGEIDGEVFEDVGDPDDELWRDQAAQRQLRPRVPIRLDVLEEPVLREEIMGDPRLSSIEILRVPRIGNPASLSPEEWLAMQDLIG